MKNRMSGIWKLLTITLFVIVYPTLSYASRAECKSCGEDAIEGLDGSGIALACTHWACDLFAMFFDTGNDLAYMVGTKMASIGLSILGVCLAIWLAFFLMPIVASFKASNPGQVFTKMGTTLFKAVVVAAFLSTGITHIYSYFVTPITAFTSALSEKVLIGSGMSFEKYHYPEIGDSILGGEIKTDLMHIVSSGIKQLDIGMEFASLVMCVARHSTVVGILDIPLIDNFGRLIVGALIWVIFGIMMILFPFYLIDAVFKVLFVSMFLPFFMVAWVFPSTKQYASKAFNIILGGLMTMVFMSLVIKVSSDIVVFPLDEHSDVGLMSLCSNGEVDKLFKVLDDSSSGGSFFFVFICGLIAIKYVTKVSELVGAFGFTTVNMGAATKALMIPVKVAGVATGTAMAVAGMIRNAKMPGKSEKEGGTGNSGKFLGEKEEDKTTLLGTVVGKVSDGSTNFIAGSIERGTDTAAQGVEMATDAAGNAVGATIKGGGKAIGGALQAVGEGSSATGIGAIIGVPLMAAGVAIDAGSQAAGEAAKQTIKMTGKAAAKMIKLTGKIAARAVKTAGKVAKKAVKAAAKQMKKAVKQTLKKVAKNLHPKELLRKGATAAIEKIEKVAYGEEIAGEIHGIRNERLKGK